MNAMESDTQYNGGGCFFVCAVVLMYAGNSDLEFHM